MKFILLKKALEMPSWAKLIIILYGVAMAGWAIGLQNQSSTSHATPKTDSVASPSTSTVGTLGYLAIAPGQPIPHDTIPVSKDSATMQRLIAAAQASDRTKAAQVIASPNVALVEGGSGVKVLQEQGELIKVDLFGRDVHGVDISMQDWWTSKRFFQKAF